jgi:hypothetical protein
MPISPYSTPIQYEYKPLNLSAFAAPLSEMQQKFDIATEDVDSADFALSNLPYGTDPERAKELIKTVKAKRDELAKNLAETKNYKQAATKLRELNSLWQKDPELNALQANAKLWAERDKAEKERVGKGVDAGGITRDQYLQWRDREIRKYKENKGAAFSANAADPEGTYNVVTGSVGRLADLSKDLEELSWKVASASPANKFDSFRAAGIDPTTLDAKFIKTIVEEKDAKKIAQVTSDYLKTLPRFRDWATEVADYNHDAIQQNPEQYKQVASDLNDKYLNSLNYQISAIEKAAKKNKDLLKGAEYTDLIEEKAKAEQAKLTGVFDPVATKNLYTHEHLNNVYDMGALGRVLAYKNVTHDYQFRDMPSATDANGNALLAEAGNIFMMPNSMEKFSIPELGKTKIDAGKSLYNTVGAINNLAAGNIRLAIMGKKNSNTYNSLISHPDQIRAKQEQLFTTLTQTIASGGDWKNFKNSASKKGITLTDNLARTIWKSMTTADPEGNNQTITEYAGYLDSSRETFAVYNNSNALLQNVKKEVRNTKEYSEFINTLGDYTPTGFDMGAAGESSKPMTAELKMQRRLFDPDSYTDAQLKKIGFEQQSGLSYAGYVLGVTDKKYLSLNDVAKLRGYKNVQDAVDKGYDFAGFKLGPINKESGEEGSTSIWWGTDNYSNKTVAQILGSATEAAYKNTTTKNEINYRVMGSKQIDKEMSKYFMGASDLTSFAPAYYPNWKSVAGFDEDGRLAPGTVLNITENKTPKLIIHGNSLFYEVPIKYNLDGKMTEGSVVIKPKLGMNVKNDDLLYMLDAASSGDTALDKQTNPMIKAARFDSKFQGNTLSPQLIQSVAVTPLADGGKRVELYSVPFDANTRLEVVKVQGKAGNNPVLKVAQVDNSGKFLGYLENPETGKDWYKNAESNEAAPAAKELIMKALAVPR